ncbi:MAG: HAD family phosphatase, partial [Longicatena sp.]
MVHNVKGVLFDFNGTMVFDSPQHKKAWGVFSKKYRGIDISEEEMEQMHGRTNKTIIELLLK